MRPARWFAAILLASTFALGFACGGKTDDDVPPADAGDAGDKCTPGQTKKLDCNTCTCMTSGEWACTGLACLDSGVDAGADSATDVGLSDPKCPKTWTEANAKAWDDLCPSIVCNYAEGNCSCPEYCGGPAPGPDWKPTWSCTPKPPPRTDGCPDAEPTVGAGCPTDAKKCAYSRCCTYEYTCTAGKWTGGSPMCPP